MGPIGVDTPVASQRADLVVGAGIGAAADEVRDLLATARVDALVRTSASDIQGMLGALEGAHLALVPLRLRRVTPLGPFDVPLAAMVERLPVTAFVLATESLTLSHEPDEDEIAAYAESLDRLDKARRNLRDIEQELTRHVERPPSSATDGSTDQGADKRSADALQRKRGAALMRVRDAEQDVVEADPDGSRQMIDPALWQLKDVANGPVAAP